MDVHYVTQKCVPIADCMSQLIDVKTGKDDPILDLQIADITMATPLTVPLTGTRSKRPT